jgi:methylenetetrahydrofolate reductase (NADPH)
MAWKDEAFSIGRQWAKLYEDGSKANGLITEIMDEFYLVNVVHNSFKDPHAIFVPFLQGEAAAAPSAKTTDSPKTNGKTNGQVNGNGVAH